MALALPPHGKLVTCDRNDKVIKIAKGYYAAAGVADKVRICSLSSERPAHLTVRASSDVIVHATGGRPLRQRTGCFG